MGIKRIARQYTHLQSALVSQVFSGRRSLDDMQVPHRVESWPPSLIIPIPVIRFQPIRASHYSNPKNCIGIQVPEFYFAFNAFQRPIHINDRRCLRHCYGGSPHYSDRRSWPISCVLRERFTANSLWILMRTK
jgi:hypothetical protein